MLSGPMSLTAYQVTAGLAGRSPAPGVRRLAIGGIGPSVGGIGPSVGGIGPGVGGIGPGVWRVAQRRRDRRPAPSGRARRLLPEGGASPWHLASVTTLSDNTA